MPRILARRELSSAQKAHLRKLLDEMKTAERAAQSFLAYCCKEHGVELGSDGWKFDTEDLYFVQEDCHANLRGVQETEPCQAPFVISPN